MSNVTVIGPGEFTERKAKIVVQAERMEDVTSPAARSLAVQTAASRLSRCGISNMPSAYPVDANGETDEDLQMGRRQGVVGYRADYEVQAGL